MITLIIAVLSMLASGPHVLSPDPPTEALANPVPGSASVQFASMSIDDIILAPALQHVASEHEASSVSRAGIASSESSIALPVYARVGPETKLDRYMDLAAKKLDRRMQRALSHIPGDGRRLLALKYYARRPGDLDSRWALNANQMSKHHGSKQHRQAVASVEAIKLRFARDNPGYRLKVTVDPRSLEEQIELWNTTASTEQAGRSILASAEDALTSDAAWPSDPTAKDVTRFAQLLASTSTTRTPTVAAPGFSRHGTGRAFDFIVCKGVEIVAGATSGSVATAWDKAGWTTKVKEAIAEVCPNFVGPLRSPYEPWHYDYDPQ